MEVLQIEENTLKRYSPVGKARHWRKARLDEYQSIIENRTWELIKNSPVEPISSQWIYKIKNQSREQHKR
jgi:hypothetical protein